MARSCAFRLSGIGFGTWAWGNQLLWGYNPERDDGRLAATFQEAVAAGLTLVDTADSYGTGRLNGRSESLLGDCIAALPPSQQSTVQIATKLAPFPWRIGRRGLDRAFRASRQRLRRHLQRVQLHWSTARYAPGQDRALLDGLADLVLDGQVKEIGVSNVGPQGLRWMHQRLAARGIRLSSVQVQYSLLAPGDARLEQILQASRELGVDVLAYSPLAFGILCQPVDVDRKPTTALRRRVFNRLLPASQDLRVAIQSIARARQVTMVQVALNWCRSNGTIPIPGLRTPEQALDVAAALKWSLTTEEKQRLDRLRERCAARMPDNPFQSA